MKGDILEHSVETLLAHEFHNNTRSCYFCLLCCSSYFQCGQTMSDFRTLIINAISCYLKLFVISRNVSHKIFCKSPKCEYIRQTEVEPPSLKQCGGMCRVDCQPFLSLTAKPVRLPYWTLRTLVVQLKFTEISHYSV